MSLLFILFVACNNPSPHVIMYQSKGIPETDQSFSFMHFKSENEGFLFGTYSQFPVMSEEELEDPYYTPQPAEEATVYKTVDGGKTWRKIDSLLNYHYQAVATVRDDLVYIECLHESDSAKNKIAVFDLNKGVRISLIDIEVISAIWTNNNEICYTESKQNSSIRVYDGSFTALLRSYNIRGYALAGILIENSHFMIQSTTHETNFAVVNENGLKEVSLPITPYVIGNMGLNNIILAGRVKEQSANEVEFVKYDVRNDAIQTLYRSDKHSIVQNIMMNETAIVGFLGNISGDFTAYELVYSLDNGKTWKIMSLQESNYVRPSCLVRNVIYIYSGNGRIQKISL